MSRTFRLRHLPQPEGGRSARVFVDSRLRNPRDLAEEAFVFHVAHVVLKLPCKIRLPENYPVVGWGKAPLYVGWHHSHDRCLDRKTRDYLWSVRQGSDYWNLGFVRTMPLWSHPVLGYGLAIISSRVKKWARKQVYRRSRRADKRLLRVTRFGPEFDPEDDRLDFEARGIKAGLARSAWSLTW